MRVLTRARWLIRQNWRRALRWRERLVISEEAFHLVMAGGVGILGGLANLAYFHGLESLKEIFLRHTGDPVEVAEVLGFWLRLAFPTVGGLVAGLVLHWGLRLVGPQGTTNYLEVVVAGDGRLPLRSGLVKTLSSLVSIGTGASIGREGGIVQLAATLASKWGQLSGWQPYRLRLLVACGVAAGIAAAYNAPISGAVFAATIVLGNFSMNLFAPLAFASVIASVLSRSFFGIKPWYVVPDFNVTRLAQLPWFILLGAVAGAVGALFLKSLRGSEDLFRRLQLPLYVKLTLGGLIVGLIATGYPTVCGNGYIVTNRILQDQISAYPSPLLFLAGLVAAKLLATSAAVGAGTVGGVFTPTLFLGAGVGSLFGMSLHDSGWAMGVPSAAFALVGMASMLSATIRSPLLAMIIVFEISLNYSLMPPLMLASVVAIVVSRRLHPASVYNEPLRAKGLALGREMTQQGTGTTQTVGDLMREPVPPLPETATLHEVADRFLSSANNFLPVVDPQQRLVGVVALQDMKAFLGEESEVAVIAHDIMRPPPACVTPDQSLIEALPVVLASEQRNIPVVNSAAGRRLVGTLVRAEVLGILSAMIAPGGQVEEAHRFS